MHGWGLPAHVPLALPPLIAAHHEAHSSSAFNIPTQSPSVQQTSTQAASSTKASVPSLAAHNTYVSSGAVLGPRSVCDWLERAVDLNQPNYNVNESFQSTKGNSRALRSAPVHLNEHFRGRKLDEAFAGVKGVENRCAVAGLTQNDNFDTSGKTKFDSWMWCFATGAKLDALRAGSTGSMSLEKSPSGSDSVRNVRRSIRSDSCQLRFGEPILQLDAVAAPTVSAEGVGGPLVFVRLAKRVHAVRFRIVSKDSLTASRTAAVAPLPAMTDAHGLNSVSGVNNVHRPSRLDPLGKETRQLEKAIGRLVSATDSVASVDGLLLQQLGVEIGEGIERILRAARGKGYPANRQQSLADSCDSLLETILSRLNSGRTISSTSFSTKLKASCSVFLQNLRELCEVQTKPRRKKMQSDVHVSLDPVFCTGHSTAGTLSVCASPFAVSFGQAAVVTSDGVVKIWQYESNAKELIRIFDENQSRFPLNPEGRFSTVRSAAHSLRSSATFHPDAKRSKLARPLKFVEDGGGLPWATVAFGHTPSHLLFCDPWHGELLDLRMRNTFNYEPTGLFQTYARSTVSGTLSFTAPRDPSSSILAMHRHPSNPFSISLSTARLVQHLDLRFTRQAVSTHDLSTLFSSCSSSSAIISTMYDAGPGEARLLRIGIDAESVSTSLSSHQLVSVPCLTPRSLAESFSEQSAFGKNTGAVSTSFDQDASREVSVDAAIAALKFGKLGHGPTYDSQICGVAAIPNDDARIVLCSTRSGDAFVATDRQMKSTMKQSKVEKNLWHRFADRVLARALLCSEEADHRHRAMPGARPPNEMPIRGFVFDGLSLSKHIAKKSNRIMPSLHGTWRFSESKNVKLAPRFLRFSRLEQRVSRELRLVRLWSHFLQVRDFARNEDAQEEHAKAQKREAVKFVAQKRALERRASQSQVVSDSDTDADRGVEVPVSSSDDEGLFSSQRQRTVQASDRKRFTEPLSADQLKALFRTLLRIAQPHWLDNTFMNLLQDSVKSSSVTAGTKGGSQKRPSQRIVAARHSQTLCAWAEELRTFRAMYSGHTDHESFFSEASLSEELERTNVRGFKQYQAFRWSDTRNKAAELRRQSEPSCEGDDELTSFAHAVRTSAVPLLDEPSLIVPPVVQVPEQNIPPPLRPNVFSSVRSASAPTTPFGPVRSLPSSQTLDGTSSTQTVKSTIDKDDLESKDTRRSLSLSVSRASLRQATVARRRPGFGGMSAVRLARRDIGHPEELVLDQSPSSQPITDATIQVTGSSGGGTEAAPAQFVQNSAVSARVSILGRRLGFGSMAPKQPAGTSIAANRFSASAELESSSQPIIVVDSPATPANPSSQSPKAASSAWGSSSQPISTSNARAVPSLQSSIVATQTQESTSQSSLATASQSAVTATRRPPKSAARRRKVGF